MDLNTYHDVLAIITVVTTVIHLYILYAIHFESTNEMTECKYFLTTLTIFDILFTVVVGFIITPYYIPDLFAASLTGLAKYFNPSMQIFWLSCGFYAGAMIIMSEDYSLAFRFVVIYTNKRLYRAFMSKWSKIGFIFLQQTIAISIAIFAYHACVQPENFEERVKLESEDIQQIFQERGFFIWFDIENDFICLLFFGILIICFILSEVLCAILIYFIHSTLKRHSENFTASTYKLHRQFTILLALQIITPILLIIFPVTGSIIASAIFQFDIGAFVFQIGFTCIHLYALTNGVFTIIFVSPYRKHFFKLIIPKCMQKKLVKFGIGTSIDQTKTVHLKGVSTVFAHRYSQQIQGNIPVKNAKRMLSRKSLF